MTILKFVQTKVLQILIRKYKVRSKLVFDIEIKTFAI